MKKKGKEPFIGEKNSERMKKQNDLGSGQFLTSKWCMTRSSLTRPVPLTENSRPIFEQNENEEKTLRLYWCFFFIV